MRLPLGDDGGELIIVFVLVIAAMVGEIVEMVR
jgi:hypothetical protein